MAEKSTRVEDQSAGEYIATREAEAQDDAANDRNIQLMDLSTRHHGFALSSKTRSGITSSDSADFTSGVPSAITSNALTVGDTQLLVAMVLIQASASTNIVMLTPVILDASNNAIGLLAPKAYQGVEPPAEGAAIRITDTSTKIITPIQAWDIFGASKIGFHVNIGAATSVDLFAAVISGIPDRNVAYDWPQLGSTVWSTGIGA